MVDKHQRGTGDHFCSIFFSTRHCQYESIAGKASFIVPADMGVRRSFWKIVTSLLVAGGRHLCPTLISLGN